MLKFSDALDLLFKHIKSVLFVFIVSLMFTLLSGFAGSLLMFIPAVPLIISILVSFLETYTVVTTMSDLFINENEEVDIKTVFSTYINGFNDLGTILKACIVPLIKTYIIVFIDVILICILTVGFVTTLSMESAAFTLFAMLIILVLFMFIGVLCISVYSLQVDIVKRLCSIYYNDDDFRYAKETVKCYKRFIWCLVPIIGTFTLNIAIIKEAKDFYKKD